MDLPSEVKKMPKWAFFVSDGVLLLLAAFIHETAAHPMRGEALIAIVACVALACVIGVIPFVTEYARRQDEALDNRQRALQALAAAIATAAEQISIATDGLQKLNTTARENLEHTRQAADTLQERLSELTSHVSSSKTEDGTVIAKFDAAAKKIAKWVGEFELAALRAAQPARVAPPMPIPEEVPELRPVLASKMVEIKPAVASSRTPFEGKPAATPAESAAPKPPQAPAPQEAAPPKRPARRAPAAEAPAELALGNSEADEEAPAAADVSEPAVSTDGATRILVTAYIGIGNRLFIRGEGPGLSWDKGVPLSFVSIGKWRWETNDAAAAVRFKLYKNDEVECSALGARLIEPGAQMELTASF